jgi:hypothetical protein
MSPELTAAPAPSSVGDRDAGRIRVGRTDYVVERPSARKASTALRLLRRVSATVKTITRELGRFEREYARDHALELDRVQARMRFPGEAVVDEAGELVRDAGGEPVMVSRLDAMSEADWERAGHVLRLPQFPNREERFGAVFELVTEDAEDELWRVLALFTLTNAEVADAKRGQRLDEELERRAGELLDDGDLADLLELAIVIAETVDRQFTGKASELGGRLGNLGRLLGLQGPQEAKTTEEAPDTPQTAAQEPQTDDEEAPPPSSSSRPTSPTGSAANSDGPPTSPSTPTTASSSPSANGSPTSDNAPRPAA